MAYDYTSRRVDNKVYSYGGEAGVLVAHLRLVYNGWNVIMVLDGRDNDQDGQPDNTTLQNYTWGLDLSGLTGRPGTEGLHGAGGIGGLLGVEDVAAGGGSSHSYWFLYDANGNVGQVAKYEAGSPPAITLAAHYEYDPYGNAITASGPYPPTNPIRFSTKWLDAETGLYYYGYRYYSPRLGRWGNRDPSEEKGGLNLYSFVVNCPTYRLDPRALWTFEGDFWYDPSDRQTPPVPRSAGECCRAAKAKGLDHGRTGGVICCDGQKIACAWYQHSSNPKYNPAIDILIQCTTEHELDHFDSVNDCWPCPALYSAITDLFTPLDMEECAAYLTELTCLIRHRRDCARALDARACYSRIDTEIATARGQLATYGCPIP